MKANNKHVALFVAFACFASFINAQNELNEIDQIIEVYQQNNASENFEYNTLFENFTELKQHPINLNKADLEELQESMLFNDFQINAFLKHLEDNGKLISIYELQAIPYFDISFIYSILPFITVGGSIDDYNIKFGKLISDGNYQFFTRYQQSFPKRSGYSDGKYLGNPSKVYFRFKYNYATRLQYGITAEKDAGEPMFKSQNKLGFDFYSLHFFWKINAKWRAIALGDYQVNLGQGLILWTGFGFNKSPLATNVKKEGSTIKPYSSVNEINFLRGAAFTFQHKNFSFTPFISYKGIDANLNYTDTLQTDIESNRIQLSGYHRTENEMASKNAIKELKIGGNIQYETRSWHVGFNVLYNNYSKPLSFETALYNMYQFQGKNLLNTSVDYHFLVKSLHFFGETALSSSKNQIGFATLNGLLFNPGKTVDASLVYRNYSVKYQTNQYTNAFAESSMPNNEQGIYFGLQIKPHRIVTLNTYIDVYKFPWLKFSADKPSKGVDFSTQMALSFSKAFQFYCTYKMEEKEQNTKAVLGSNNEILITKQNKPYIDAYFNHLTYSINDVNQEILKPNNIITKQALESATFITPQLTQRLRFHLTYVINKTWTFQSRLELSTFNDKINGKQNGIMLFQDVNYNPMSKPYAFSARIAVFDVQNFDGRIFAYESDVLYSFSVPALYNTGLRYYFNAQYKINKHFQIWAKFAHTIYTDIKEIGTGTEQINNNKLYDIHLQMRYQF